MHITGNVRRDPGYHKNQIPKGCLWHNHRLDK